MVDILKNNNRLISNRNVAIDIVIVNYYSTAHTIKCIESIYSKSNGLVINIIVVDNSSNDNPEKIGNLFPEICLLKCKRNLGFGKAVNLAFSYGTAPIVILFNPDTLVLDGFFNEIIEYIQQNPAVGIAGPKIFEDDWVVQGSARRFPTPMTSILGRKSPLSKLFPKNQFTRKEFVCFGPSCDMPIDVDWVSGACMIVRRKAFEDSGGFDENLFLYWEDTDLCKRMKDKGWGVSYFPKAEIYHLTGKSSAINPLFSMYHFHRSCFYLYKKHISWPKKIFTPIAFIGLAIRCCIVMLFYLIKKTIDENNRKRNYSIQNVKRCSSKIRVLRIVSRLNIGGPSIHAILLTKHLNERGYESILIAGKPAESEGSMGYLIEDSVDAVYQIPQLQRELQPVKDFIAFIKILIYINKFRPHIVHTHMAKAGAIARFAVLLCNLVLKTKIKTVHTFHGHVLEGYFNNSMSKLFMLIERLIGKYTSSIIAISKTQKWELSTKYKIASPNKIDIINLGFDLIPFVSAKKQIGRFRRLMNFDKNRILIGIVGRLVPIKNHQLFLDAAKLFLQMNQYKSISFIIIGDGILRKKLEAYTKEIGIEKTVHFYGWERNIPIIYADIDILALTSLNEGTPVSIIEAMAAKVPVVTTGVGGVKDLLGKIINTGDERCGFHICERGILCPKDDSLIFANAINYWVRKIRENKDLPQLDNAQRFVLKNYSDTRLLYNICLLYDKLLSKQ